MIEEGAEFHAAIRQAESEFMARMSVVLVPPAAPGAASSMNMIGGDTGDKRLLTPTRRNKGSFFAFRLRFGVILSQFRIHSAHINLAGGEGVAFHPCWA